MYLWRAVDAEGEIGLSVRHSIGDKTVKQARAARTLQILLTTSSGSMRRVPGLHVPADFQSKPVMMTDNCRSFTAAGPIATRRIAARGRVLSLRIGAGQHVVGVYCIAATADDFAFLGQGSLFGDVVGIRVQVFQILGNDDAFGILPWAFADAVTGIDTSIASGRRRAQIRTPVRL